MILSSRSLERVFSFVLLALVVLSWSYVIYASRVAARWQLESRDQCCQICLELGPNLATLLRIDIGMETELQSKYIY
ncbi:unnamed protein product [Gadus morhua 'NCC']